MLKGTTHSNETLLKISQSRQGKGLGNKNAAGSSRSSEFRNRVSLALSGDRSHRWLGDAVGYRGIHLWINKKLGRASKCSSADATCTNNFHWSNISGNYLRDIDDWQQLCVSHHKRYDND